MKPFPYLSLPASLTVLRITTAIMFLAHAAVRVLNGTIPQFSAFMAAKGFPFPTALVWAITVFELVGGVMLIADRGRRVVTAGFMAIALGGIVIIHAQLGWFVGEHGTGGVEYSIVLMAACLVLAAADGISQEHPQRG